MSRTIAPCISLPSTGNTLSIPFPDIAKPVPGGWVVTVSLRSTTIPPAETVMQVVQGGRVVASTTFTPSTSFADYSLMVGGTALAPRDGAGSNVTQGTCSVSSPVVLISDSLRNCCDPPIFVPSTIHATISSSGTAAPINGMELEVPIFGSVTVPVCDLLTFTIETDNLAPNPPCDPLYIIGVDARFTSDGHGAGGIHTSLACSFFQGTPITIGTINLQRDCHGVLFPGGDEPCLSVLYTL